MSWCLAAAAAARGGGGGGVVMVVGGVFFPLQLLVGSKAANLLAVDYIVNLSVALTSRLKVRMRGWRKA